MRTARRMLPNDTNHFANDLNACFNDTRFVLFTFTDTFYWYFTDTFYRYFIGWQNRQNGQTFTFTDTFYSNRQTNRQNKQAESFFEWREHCIQFLNCTGSTRQRPWHYLYLDPLNTNKSQTNYQRRKMFHSRS